MMNEMVYLLSSAETVNSVGDTISVPTVKAVFAEVASVGYREHYMAEGVGKRPEIKFVLSDYLDYSGEPQARYNGKTYNIDRTYREKNNRLELTCSRL